MFDYSSQLEAFFHERVRLPSSLEQLLFAHRKANRERLVSRLPEHIVGVKIGETSFRPQGSVAMQTVIQTRFDDEEYDIDDGVVISRKQLVDERGVELSADTVRDCVRDALKDRRFNRPPELMTNCVRVFYADDDDAKHHVDIPVYREWTAPDGDKLRELAGEGGWQLSDPTQVNSWFDSAIADRNKIVDGWGRQLRRLVRLLKRFCRSRRAWLELLPNGMKLTMLVAECQPAYSERLDVAFATLCDRKNLFDARRHAATINLEAIQFANAA